MVGGKDACHGDSGGPLICVVDNEPVLYGVVSWGRECALPDFPGIYGKVSSIIDWIEDNTISWETTIEPTTTATTTLYWGMPTETTTFEETPPATTSFVMPTTAEYSTFRRRFFIFSEFC